MTGSVLLGIFIATNAGYFYLDPESSRFAPWLALYTLQFGLLALSPVVDAWYVVIVYRSGLTKGTGVLSGARRIDVTMSITRIPL